MPRFFYYRIVFSIVFLIVWSFFAPSPFRKGGVSPEMHYAIVVLTVTMGFVHTVMDRNLIYVEKVLFGLLIPLTALVVGWVLSGWILERMYDDVQIQGSRLICNSIFYAIVNLISIGTLSIIMIRRQRQKSQG